MTDLGEFKANVDLASLIEEEARVSFKKMGRNMVALCPFHKETEPSFTVFPDGHYTCFGCNAQGDHIEFLKTFKNLDFGEAVEELRSFVEFEHPVPPKPPQKRATGLKSTIAGQSEVSLELLEYWAQNLWNVPASFGRLDYLRGRLFTDETIKTHMLGWRDGYYVIPVFDGAPGLSPVISVRLRAGEGQSLRYKGLKGYNSPALYNRYSLWTLNTAFVFFGEFDALLAHQDGLGAVSPTNGKGSFQREWVKYFDRIDRVYIVPDGIPDEEHEDAVQIAGLFSTRARILRWHYKDYTNFRISGKTVRDFLDLVRPLR